MIPVPLGFRVQPIDPDEVAARLVELALGQARGRVPDMGGPQVFSFAELIRTYLRARHRRRPGVPIWMPATGGIRAGALLVREQATRGPMGRRTWAEFLAERLR